MKTVALVVVLLLVLAGCGSDTDREQIDAFAKCLTEKGTTMYGTFWCPHCGATKKMFGSSFQYINYVECDPRGTNEQSERCIAENIEAYDTWQFADGSRTVGEPSFEELSAGSGCPAPKVE